MILLLDTSTATCRLSLVDGDARHDFEWLAERQLAKGLLEYIKTQLSAQSKTLYDISAIGVLQGPGSFTSLRIGLTVCNTIADSLGVAIVGETGDDWQSKCLDRLQAGNNQRIVMPVYGSEANITTQRK